MPGAATNRGRSAAGRLPALLGLALLGPPPLPAQVWENAAAGDPAKQMVDGILRHLERRNPPPGKQDLARLLGVIDPRVPPGDLELVATPRLPALRASAPGFDAFAVRWQVLEGIAAEGLLLQPKRAPTKRIIAIPDAGMPPERMTAMQAEAANGAQVLIPALIDRGSKWSPPGQTHREFLYRMSFPFGRHPLGYEIQKALAAVDWLSAQTPGGLPTHVIGYGEGAAIAAYAKAMDARIDAGFGAGFAWNRADVGAEPIDRNVWKIRLADVKPLPPYAFRAGNSAIPPAPDADARMKRQIDETARFNQSLVAKSERVREAAWHADESRRKLWDDVLGRIPKSGGPLRAQRRASYESAKWTGYEVQFDVLAPDLFGYGVLLLPKGVGAGEKRPVVVVQHGLEGRPQDLFQATGREFETYRNLAETFADLGYVVYAPQNPHRGGFRLIARQGNPLGLSLDSFILAQHEKMLDFLAEVPEADAERIGIYGFSRGGRAALLAGALLPQFKAVVCSGHFSEWTRKAAGDAGATPGAFAGEDDTLDFDLANVAGHAELAKLIAPRPFLVERGHGDRGGGDEWVGYEYAKVRRHYDGNGWGDRTGIAWFNGAHRVDGAESIPFLRKWLGR